MIPQENAENLSIRKLVTSSIFEDILSNFNRGDTDPQLYINQKYSTDINTKKIKSGDILKGTEIIRDLTRKSYHRKLGKIDTKLLKAARYMFISELMQVRSLSEKIATSLLDSILTANLNSETTDAKTI